MLNWQFYYQFCTAFMRVIETSLEEDLAAFSRFLRAQQVPHRIYEERGAQVVEVPDERLAQPVRAAFNAWRRGELTLPEEDRSRSGSFDPQRLVALLKRYPVLSSLLFLSIAAFPFRVQLADGQLPVLIAELTFLDLTQRVEPGLNGLPFTQPWRFVTPVFLHFSVVHLLFNVAITTELGRRLEAVAGSSRFLLMVLCIGLTSNVVQYLWSAHPLFGGLSGVAYGMLGCLLVWQRRFPDVATLQMPNGLAAGLLVFLVLFTTGVTELFGLHVANGAHWAGLVGGMALGVATRPRQPRS